MLYNLRDFTLRNDIKLLGLLKRSYVWPCFDLRGRETRNGTLQYL